MSGTPSGHPTRWRIGVDLGGSKIEAIALDRRGRESLRRRCDTPAGDYPATLEAIAGLVESIEQELGATARVGIGTPGSRSPADGRIRNANSVCLNGRRLDRDLAARLRRPVRIANDADCFALSEAVDGAAAGVGSVFGVILGTGTGGGLVIHGRLLEGPNAIVGEWGHNPLPWPGPEELPGPACYCGKRGCIETFLSGPGLSLEHRRRSDRAMSPIEILDAALGGDPDAEHSLRIYEDRLARGLASVINLLDPQIIVLGGGLSNMRRLYRNVPALLPNHVFSDVVRTRLVPPAHGDSGGVRGAAWLWPAVDDDPA